MACRSLARVPALAIGAVSSIALGIAAATAVISVVDATLLRPPPFANPDRLVVLYSTRREPGRAEVRERWSWARASLLRSSATSYESLATYSPSVLALTGAEGVPEPLDAEFVSSSYLHTLAVHLSAGHDFAAGDESVPRAEIILSQSLWQRRFGGDPSVVGRVVQVNGVPLVVVGIAPAGFAGVSGRARAWIPAAMATRLSYADYLVTNQNFISVIGRLRDGVSVAQARAELAIRFAAIERALPVASHAAGSAFGSAEVTLNEARVDPAARRPILLLLAAALCLLLLSCVNVAGLFLGRAAGRRREIAVRLSLGASRRRLVQQLLVEAAVVAAAGGLLGALLAPPITTLLASPAGLPRASNMYGAIGEFATARVDARIVAFCALLSAATTFVFGLLPALRATRIDLAADLRAAGADAHGSPRSALSARRLIVGIEAALATLMLVAAGLLGSTWRRFATTDVGFDPAHVLTFMIRPSDAAFPPSRAPALIDAVLASVESVPGVEAATVDGGAPASTGCASSTLFIADRLAARLEDAPPVLRHYVAPQHFRVLNVPLLSGRLFNDGDRAGSPRVAIVNELAARRFWPNESPLGKRVWFGGGSSFDRPDSSAEIVGVVGNVAYQTVDDRPFQPDFYTPYRQFTYAARTVLVRATVSPAAVIAAVQRALRRADPGLAMFETQPLADRIGASWSRLAQQTQLLVTFAALAIALCAVGIVAVIAQAIGERRREIGVRSALGASPAQLLAAVARYGGRPACVGLVAGFVGALGAGRIVASAVPGVPAFDLPTACIAVGVAFVVIVLSTLAAARRALSITPTEALRS